jgi:hypothetical protein
MSQMKASSNICTLEQILNAESHAALMVAIIAIRINEGPTVFRRVMQNNLDRGVEYRYLLVGHGDRSLAKSFMEFQFSLRTKTESAFQGRLIDYIYVESDVTLIDPALDRRQGYILGDNVTAESYHLKVTGKSLLRICDRFNYLWQVARDLD